MEHSFLINAVVTAVAVLLTSMIVPGFEVRGFFTAVFAAIAIAIMNFLFLYLLLFQTLPLILVTFGLFVFVVNAIILKMSAAVIPGFEIRSWFSAIMGAVVLTVVNIVLRWIVI